ncbi:MAG TPA: hypothetical protein VG826_32990 [Pirellulales bacterium]|nr:hypothetical protein [Pirellulales bacterium]
MSRRSRNTNGKVAAGGAGPAGVPAGTPDWITPELIGRTIEVWQPFYRTVLTPEEAVTMILNVGRLYDALSSGSLP